MPDRIIAGTPAFPQAGPVAAAAAPAITPATELGIQIEPRGQVIWSGTRAQIVAELPHLDYTKWGDGAAWDEGDFSYWLIQRRPAGMSGEDWKASDMDHWFLHQRLVVDRGTGFAAASVYEAREALRLVLWSQSLGGMVQFERALAARRDQAYCRFMILAGAVKPPRRKLSRKPRGQVQA